jgi:hypothetical protein
MSNNKQHTFHIGQIIYLLSEEAEAIVPAIVVEEQVVKKLDGNSVSWKVAVGPPNKRKEVDSKDLKGEIHTSLEDIRAVMTKRLEDFVDNLVGTARKRTETWYGHQMLEKVNEDGSGGKIDPASLMNGIDGEERQMPFVGQVAQSNNVIENGMSYRVKMPSNIGPLKPETNLHGSIKTNINPADPKADLKRQLLEMAMPEEDDAAFGDGEYVMTDDGNRVPVKFNIGQ